MFRPRKTRLERGEDIPQSPTAIVACTFMAAKAREVRSELRPSSHGTSTISRLAIAVRAFGDLWFYDWSTNFWTWISGSDTVDSLGNYGIIGVAAADNQPGSRHHHAMALDAVNRALYIFAGYGPSTYTGLGTCCYHVNQFRSSAS